MLVLHWPVLWAAPYFDDWPFVELGQRAFQEHGFWGGLWNILFAKSQLFWRPLLVLGAAPVVNESSIYSQGPKLAAIVLLAYLLVRVARRFELPNTVAWLCGCGFMLHQSMVIGYQVDRWGDIFVTGAVLGVLLAAQRAVDSDRDYTLGTALLTVVALLGKEAGVVLFVIPAAYFVLSRWRNVTAKLHLRALVTSLSVIILYFAARWMLGIGVVTDDSNPYYHLHVGINIFYNFAIVASALFLPVSLVHILIDGGMWTILGVIGILVWSGVCLAGFKLIWRSQHRNTVLLLTGLFFLIQGPTLLMSRTTELNLSRSLPFGILAAAFCLHALVLHRDYWKRILFALGVVSLVGHVHATAVKVDDVRESAERAQSFRDVVTELMPNPPPRTIVFEADSSYWGYLSYGQPLWKSLRGEVGAGLRLRYGDPNYHGSVTFIGATQARSNEADFFLTSDNVLVSSSGDSVQVLPLDERYVRFRHLER